MYLERGIEETIFRIFKINYLVQLESGNIAL